MVRLVIAMRASIESGFATTRYVSPARSDSADGTGIATHENNLASGTSKCFMVEESRGSSPIPGISILPRLAQTSHHRRGRGNHIMLRPKRDSWIHESWAESKGRFAEECLGQTWQLAKAGLVMRQYTSAAHNQLWKDNVSPPNSRAALRCASC